MKIFSFSQFVSYPVCLSARSTSTSRFLHISALMKLVVSVLQPSRESQMLEGLSSSSFLWIPWRAFW